MSTFFDLFYKEMPLYQKEGEKVLAFFITARPLGLGIPGGLFRFGEVEYGALKRVWTPYYHARAFEHVAKLFALSLRKADAEKVKEDNETGGSFDALDYFKLRVTRPVKSQVTRVTQVVFVLAYRESEAREALAKEGYTLA